MILDVIFVLTRKQKKKKTSITLTSNTTYGVEKIVK